MSEENFGHVVWLMSSKMKTGFIMFRQLTEKGKVSGPGEMSHVKSDAMDAYFPPGEDFHVFISAVYLLVQAEL